MSVTGSLFSLDSAAAKERFEHRFNTGTAAIEFDKMEHILSQLALFLCVASFSVVSLLDRQVFSHSEFDDSSYWITSSVSLDSPQATLFSSNNFFSFLTYSECSSFICSSLGFSTFSTGIGDPTEK